MTSSRMSQTSSSLRSSIFLADLIVSAWPSSLSRRMMNGWNSSRAIFLGRPHWCSLQFRADDDDRAGRVVDALAEQVLAEPALLALDHVGQRLQRAVADEPSTGRLQRLLSNRASTDCWSIRFSLRMMTSGALRSTSFLSRLLRLMMRRYRSFRSLVAKLPLVEQHQRPQVRRDDRDALQDHPLGLVVAVAQRLDDLEPLDQVLGLLLAARSRASSVAELLREARPGRASPAAS